MKHNQREKARISYSNLRYFSKSANTNVIMWKQRKSRDQAIDRANHAQHQEFQRVLKLTHESNLSSAVAGHYYCQ